MAMRILSTVPIDFSSDWGMGVFCQISTKQLWGELLKQASKLWRRTASNTPARVLMSHLCCEMTVVLSEWGMFKKIYIFLLKTSEAHFSHQHWQQNSELFKSRRRNYLSHCADVSLMSEYKRTTWQWWDAKRKYIISIHQKQNSKWRIMCLCLVGIFCQHICWNNT